VPKDYMVKEMGLKILRYKGERTKLIVRIRRETGRKGIRFKATPLYASSIFALRKRTNDVAR